MRITWLISLLVLALHSFSEEIIIQNGLNGYDGCIDSYVPKPYSQEFEPKGLLPYMILEGGH